MAAGAEHHLHLAAAQELIGTHDVVAGLDLMVDVLDAWTRRREHGDGVVHLVDAQERRLADAVAHPGIGHPRPE